MRTKAGMTLLSAFISALFVTPVQAQLGCDRACLTGYVDAWFNGLVNNDAVLFNLDDAEPSGWAPDYGPPRGGW